MVLKENDSCNWPLWQSHTQVTARTLQVLHIKTNHWIVANTKERGKTIHVCILQSGKSSADTTHFYCGMKIIHLMPCQKQMSATDYGFLHLLLPLQLHLVRTLVHTAIVKKGCMLISLCTSKIIVWSCSLDIRI